MDIPYSTNLVYLRGLKLGSEDAIMGSNLELVWVFLLLYQDHHHVGVRRALDSRVGGLEDHLLVRFEGYT